MRIKITIKKKEIANKQPDRKMKPTNTKMEN